VSARSGCLPIKAQCNSLTLHVAHFWRHITRVRPAGAAKPVPPHGSGLAV
jgi:hypothetical protein